MPTLVTMTNKTRTLYQYVKLYFTKFVKEFFTNFKIINVFFVMSV